MRRIVLIILTLTIMFCFGGLLSHYQSQKASFQSVKVILPSNVKASIYKGYPKSTKIIQTIQGTQTVTLSYGTYEFVLDDPAGIFNKNLFQQTVAYGTGSITITPEYSAQKLAELLTDEQASAISKLYAEYPLVQKNYTITKQQLFGIGDWYGAVLTPNDPSLDRLNVILHKVDNDWFIAAEPAINIGKPSHQDIPSQILSNVGKLASD